MTTSLRNFVGEIPFPLPQRVQRWSVAVPKSNADPELMQRMGDEIAAATFTQRLREQGTDV